MAYGTVIYKNPQFQQFTIALLSIPQWTLPDQQNQLYRKIVEAGAQGICGLGF